MDTEPSAGPPSTERAEEVGPIQPSQPGIALIGVSGWNTIPLATTPFNGVWKITNNTAGQFPAFAAQSGVKPVTGNFSGLGWTAIALLGGPGWNTIPVAFPRPGGYWTVTNQTAAGFSGWSQEPGATALTGDFAGTGKTAIALTGGAGWNTMPLALSNGDGTWTVSNLGPEPGSFTQFPQGAAQSGVTAVAGDFSYGGTPRPGIALVGGLDWDTVPVAFAQMGPGGTWLATNPYVGEFGGWAAQPGVRVVTGKFSNSGLTDIALLGPGWGTIPVAFANPEGGWTVTNQPAPQFPQWGTTPGVTVVTGRFSNNGLTDIALLGSPFWDTIPVAFANGDGSWSVTNQPVKDFPGLSSEWDVTAVPCDFSSPSRWTTIALTGGSDWSSIPIAVSSGNGNGNWSVNQNQVISFPGWAATSGATALPVQVPTTS